MEFSGKGGRKPQVDIDISKIFLDEDNPRLRPYQRDEKSYSQKELLEILLAYFDTETIALSLISNGYFDEEPLVVVVRNHPEDFDLSSFETPEEKTSQLNQLIESDQIDFTVVEGNRRTAAIKLLLNGRLRKELNIDSTYPEVDSREKAEDISKVPCIVYENRAVIAPYLGVRHIAGLLKWEAFAQAAYTFQMVEAKVNEGSSISEAILTVKQLIGDRSNKIKKQYLAYKLYEEAYNKLEFDVRPIRDKFSLLTVAYGQAGIREYIGLPNYQDVDLEADLVDDDHLEEFRDVLSWIYGDKHRNILPIIRDSRKITSDLGPILKSETAVQHLKSNLDLAGAFELSAGREEYISRKLSQADRAIRLSLQYAFEYQGNEELYKKVQELMEVIRALEIQLASRE